jgi:diaminohydroxyphosphoribosylaminopyrimidine deaminase/5-amino-6-(5-phosphoribosylamino)uracil reductase
MGRGYLCANPCLTLTIHQKYMQRCIELARLGAGYVAPNPMVGAVLVHENRIIGEGYHQKFGDAHAEVNCLASVQENNIPLIASSTLYVSLEPCNHYGKTPPCTELIIEKKIPKVVIGCLDPAAKVNGKGIQQLKEADVEVEYGILEEECKELNRRFYVFQTLKRPYVILKWAQTNDRFLADTTKTPGKRLFISNEETNRLVHRWRSEEMAILVGTNTASSDNPELTTRLWPGNSPLRLVVDMDLSLPAYLKLFDGSHPTIVFNTKKHTIEDFSLGALKSSEVSYYQVTPDVSLVHQVLHALFKMNILSVMVEGGASLLQSFIEDGSWDETRIITNTKMNLHKGIPAPVPNRGIQLNEMKILGDVVGYYINV